MSGHIAARGRFLSDRSADHPGDRRCHRCLAVLPVLAPGGRPEGALFFTPGRLFPTLLVAGDRTLGCAHALFH